MKISAEAEKSKVFVIGRNKTGTTSLAKCLQMLGYRVGDQAKAEMLFDRWATRNFAEIVDYCKEADAFQDIPFSLDYTFQALDQAYPDAKFILSVRDSADDWYDSLIRFHTAGLGMNRLPTADDLKEYVYHRKGAIWDAQRMIFGIDETTLYDRDIYLKHYESHTSTVEDYFKNKQGKLLTINLSTPDAMERLCLFLDIPFANQVMPHLNASS